MLKIISKKGMKVRAVCIAGRDGLRIGGMLSRTGLNQVQGTLRVL